MRPGHVFSPVGHRVQRRRGEGGGRRHLMSSVWIKERPARLVESAAAPSEPMSFELRETGREGPHVGYIYRYI